MPAHRADKDPAAEGQDDTVEEIWLGVDVDEFGPRCPVCGEYPDYCLGHGEIGDPRGYQILQEHMAGDHFHCREDCEL